MSICQKTEDGYKILASSNGSIVNNRLDYYSSSDKIIGYWTNGKPIHRRVLTLSADNKGTSQTVQLSSLGITKVEKIINYRGLIMQSSKETPIPKYFGADSVWNVEFVVDSSTIVYTIGSGYTVPAQIHVLLEYTSTEDATDTSRGTSYSTKEKFTGDFWIDGKPIYRKVIAVSNFTVDNVLRKVTIVDKSTLYIDKIIDMHARGLWNGTEFNFPYCNVVKNNLDDVTITVTMQVDGDNVVFTTFRNTGSTNVTDVYAIIEYTKTTD